MKKLKKIASVLMLAAAVVFAEGCTKPDEPNNGGNDNGGGNNDVSVTVTTATPSDITATTAVCGAEVTVSEGATLSELGVCWSKLANPTASDNHLSIATWNEPFTCTLTELEPNTVYHVRAYALRNQEYYYGADKSFTTLDNGPIVPEGAVNGFFTINEEGDLVRFSHGNLQYQATTNTWRFALNQYDYIGEDNAHNSLFYSDWIDLFGWGTSGWDCGNDYYRPTDIEYRDEPGPEFGFHYGPSGEYSLIGEYANSDWGVYNAISNGGNQPGMWRTLGANEWNYIVFNRRPESGCRLVKAQVNAVNGLILLPDNWTTETYPFANMNNTIANYEGNVISALDWSMLEDAGCVFLPAAGFRYVSEVRSVNEEGDYWSRDHSNINAAGFFWFKSNTITNGLYAWPRWQGRSVRLVQDVQ
jgi:hypothetical protein